MNLALDLLRGKNDSYNYPEENISDISYKRVYKMLEDTKSALMFAKFNGVQSSLGEREKISDLYLTNTGMFEEIFGKNNNGAYCFPEGYGDTITPNDIARTLNRKGRKLMSITCRSSFSPGKKNSFEAVSELVKCGLIRVKDQNCSNPKSLAFAKLQKELAKSPVTLADLIIQERRESD